MGSIPTLPRPATPPPTPDHSSSDYHVYAVFCFREPTPSRTMSNWIQYYKPSDNTWNFVSSIPGLIENHVLKSFSMVSIGDSIYIIGGLLFNQQRADQSSEESNLPVQVLSSVLRYNVHSQQWFKCASLSIPRYDFACTVCENKIYVAGGHSTWASATGVSSAEVYDPNHDEWAPLPSMSTMRYKCVGVTWKGKIHVVGGFAVREYASNENPLTFTPERSSVEVYNTQGGNWDLMRRMWQLDVPPNQIVDVNGKLFSSGDCLKVWKGHIEAYDGEQNIWNEVDGSRLQTLISPVCNSNSSCENRALDQQLLYLTIAPIGTQLYFLAGYQIDDESSRTKSIVHVFDTSATRHAWRSFEPVEEEGQKVLCSHCCVVRVS
ncbi:hypothetical protein UlMin_011796 [Ulmus minor]